MRCGWPAPSAASRMIAPPTPTTSCSTDQPISRCSVSRIRGAAPAAGDVDDDHARRHRDREPEERGGRELEPEARERDERRAERDRHLDRRRPEHRRMLAAELTQVDLDADLEQQEDRPDLGEQADLGAVRDVARGERRDGEPDGEVADDRRQRQAPGEPAGAARREQDRADLEHGDRGVLHPRMVRAARLRRAAPALRDASGCAVETASVGHSSATPGWQRRAMLGAIAQVPVCTAFLGGAVMLGAGAARSCVGCSVGADRNRRRRRPRRTDGGTRRSTSPPRARRRSCSASRGSGSSRARGRSPTLAPAMRAEGVQAGPGHIRDRPRGPTGAGRRGR